MDLVGGDGEDQPGLAAAAVPGVGAAGIALSESLDVLGRTVGSHVDDPTADGVVTGRVRCVGDADRDPRIAVDVLDLAEAPDGVDEDVFAIGVDPGLGELRRAVRHGGGQEAGAGLGQQ